MTRASSTKQDVIDLSWVFLAVILGALFAFYSHDMRNTWPGISPPPSHDASLFYGFGDTQLSYRNVGLTLQNAGDTGGRVTNFKDYDYNVIEQWLWLADSLDVKANYVPSLAAYYFGAVKEPEKLRHLIGYLSKSGEETTGEHWRWLAHAIYLARFEVKDQALALDLARKLAAEDNPNLPVWTKVMPAYVEKNMGRKKDARDLLLLLIADPSLKQEQNDRNQSCWYIDKYLREPGDNLEANEIYKNFCVPYLDSQKKEKNS